MEELLALLEFPEVLDLDLVNQQIKKLDFQGITIYSAHVPLNHNYIHHYEYRKREDGEYWKSLDIYIKSDKLHEVIEIINIFLLEQGLNIIENIDSFRDLGDREVFFRQVLNDKIRLDLFKIDSKLSLQIVRFD